MSNRNFYLTVAVTVCFFYLAAEDGAWFHWLGAAYFLARSIQAKPLTSEVSSAKVEP